ncbi:MAG TPA: hypothetical protein VFT67_01875 [Jatrophihabitantaceae bacterium]|nr:hypothetical protein [Jatrophihabitantaceae bacterium]
MAWTASWRRPRALLALVAALHGLSPLLVLGPHYWFGVDETIYLSQINGYAPPNFFSAPRSRGVTFLAAPVTLLTDSTVAIRVWLAVLSAIALYLAFRPWLHVLAGRTAVLAALLFSTIWVVIYYAFEVMPNYWSAAAVVAATGYALRFLREGRRWQLVAVGVAMGLVALIRPSDAMYGGVVLAACALFVSAAMRRRLGVVAAIAVGSAAGAADWVVEAFTSYGGLGQRIHQAQAENGGPGVHFAGAAQWRTLAGPVLCRNGCRANASFLYQWWWLALIVLVAVGLGYARRERDLTVHRFSSVSVPTVVGLAMAAQYVFEVTYSAPRFLTPTYALLALPAASGAVHLVKATSPGVPRFALAGGMVLVLALNAGIEVNVITANLKPNSVRSSTALLADADYLNGAGVDGPCILLGTGRMDVARLAYATGCTDRPAGGPALRERMEDGTRVLWLGAGRVRYPGVHWQQLHLPVHTSSLPRLAWLSTSQPTGPDSDTRA